MKKLKLPKSKVILKKIPDLKSFRNKHHEKQKFICPILKQKIPVDDVVVDHKHKNKNEPIGVDGKGLVRGVIQTQANALEGKISNNFSRYGLIKFISLPEYLRNLADYLENPPVKPIYIHPNEETKEKKLKKNSVKKLNKLYLEKYPNRKPLSYPKSEKLTKNLRIIYKEFGLKPEFRK